jgi:glycosyltransferase involved in cell wall biosynthesis
MLTTGGTEIATLRLAEALVDGGAEVELLCFYEFDHAIVQSVADADVNVSLMKRQRRSGLINLLELASLTFAIRRHLRKTRPSVVHVQYVTPGLVPVVAARLAGTRRIFATVHQSGSQYGFTAHAMLRCAALLCSRFLCISNAVEQSWFGSVKDGTIYNCVEVNRIRQASEKADQDALLDDLQLPLGVPVIGVVARLHPVKGIDFCLDALTQLHESISDFRLVIVGDGPARSDLTRRAESLNLASKIKWLGNRPQAEVFQLFSIMDIVVVPSRSEGLGLTAIEAGAAGKPVIATNVDGLPEVIEDGRTGLLIEFGDCAALAEAMRKLIGSADLRREYGNCAANAMRQRFSVDAYRQAILELYVKSD